MNQYEYGHGPGGRRGGWGRWLIPLIVGIGLGALLFNGPRMMFGGNFGYQGNTSSAYAPNVEQHYDRAAPQVDPREAAPRAPVAPQPRDDRGERGERFAGGPFAYGGHWGGFGLGRFIIPLLLIGGGVWLINRRRGPGNGGGPGSYVGGQYPQHGPAAPQAPAAQPTPPTQTPPTPPADPATGETRML